MKILISTDIEGVAGVFHSEQVRAGNGEYERARAWMTAEANAAVQGAIAGGAGTFWSMIRTAVSAICCPTAWMSAPAWCWASRATWA